MDVLVCEWCDKLFQSKGHKLCDACKVVDMKRFSTVSEFIRDSRNRESTLNEIVETTGVSEKDISRYIREGRLIVKDLPNFGISCVACGKLTNDGNMCRGCRTSLSESFGVAVNEYDNRKNNGGFGMGSTYRLD